MANLALCLKKTGVKISKSKKDEMLGSYNELKDLGTGHTTAANKVIADLSKSLNAERKKVVAMLPVEPVKPEPAVVKKEVKEKKIKLDPKKAIKYSAAPAVETAAFKTWFGKSVVAKMDGTPIVMYHGTLADFSVFDVGDIGYHFGNISQAESRLVTKTQHSIGGPGNIMPVYLKIDNPARMKDIGAWDQPDAIADGLLNEHIFTEDEHNAVGNVIADFALAKDWKTKIEAEFSARLNLIIKKLKDKGYDGIVYKNLFEGVKEKFNKKTGAVTTELQDSYIAFDSTQIKSATGNVGTFATEEADIRYSEVGTWRDTITNPGDRSVIDGIGYIYKEKTSFIEKLSKKWNKDYIIRKIIDSKHAQRVLEKTQDLEASESGYKVIKMLSSFPTIFKQFLEHGTVAFDATDQWIEINQNNPSLFNSLRKLQEGEMEPFMYRMLALSGQELIGKDRSKLFGKELEDQGTIDKLFKMAAPAYEANKKVWDEVVKDLEKVNTEFLNFMEGSGMIDPQQRLKWQRKYYIPFTRMIEDIESGDMETLYQNAGGKDIKKVIRKLKGGESRLGDPTANLVNNYSFMMNEALTNIARRKSIAVMENADQAEETGKSSDQNVFKVYEKGKVKYYRVFDPILADTITDLHGASKGRTSEFLTFPKKLLTWGVTIMPAFRVANAIRDAAHTALIEKSFNPFIDSYKGFMGAMRNTPDMIEFATTGGAFSGAYYARDIGKKPLTRAIKKLRKDIHKEKKGKPRQLYELWDKIGESSENAARLGLYMKLRKAGVGKLQAGYKAKDLLDFYQSGQGALLQAAIRTIPFLNARIQGVYKIGKVGMNKQSRGNLMLRGAMLTTIAGILHAMNADDEKYKELRDFERLQYLNFMNVPGLGHVRIPLPFELGAAFGSLPVYFGQWASGSVDEQQMFEVIKDTLIDTFRLDIPQFAKPLAQQWANKNLFTGGRIETMSDVNVEPWLRWDQRTSKMARAVGEKLNWSPKRIDQFMKDIFAGVGQTGLYLTDQAFEWVSEYPEDPAVTVGDRYISGIGRFFKGTAEKVSTKMQQNFYDLLAEADMANSTFNKFKTLGDPKTAKAYFKSKKGILRYKKYLSKVQKAIRRYNEQIKIVALRSGLSPEEKQTKINTLLIKRNKLFRKATTKLERKR